jgi:hypothetical protein
MSERPLPRQIFGHLATFIAVADTLSFLHAAEAMGRSRPAITAHAVRPDADAATPVNPIWISQRSLPPVGR